MSATPAWRAANKVKLQAQQRAWYAKNKVKALAWRRAYYLANRAKVLAYNKARYEAKKPEIQAKNARFRKANPEKMKGYQIKKLYGITLIEYYKLKQRKTCEICGNRFKSSKDQHLDHDHVTEKIRGVVCGGCNWGLGHFRDNPKLLRKAARFLERWA